MSRKLLFFLLLFFLAIRLQGQPRCVVSGFLSDSKTGEALIGGTVSGGDRGAVTNSDGFYSLSVGRGVLQLSFSYVGYEEHVITVSVQKDTVINISLTPSSILEEAVVTAYSSNGFMSTGMGAIEVPLTLIQKAPAPLGEPDILKALQVLPGVQAGMDGSSGIFIRGGGPDENLYLLDWVPVYNVSHLLGIFSAFTPGAVKRLTLYKGDFPAEYGGRVSGIVDINTNDGNTTGIHGSFGVGLLTDKVHLEGPLFSSRTTFSVSARALHTLFARPFVDLTKQQYFYSFYDASAKVVHRIGDSDKLALTLYAGNDNASFIGDESLVGKRSEGIGIDYFRRHEEMKARWGTEVAAFRWSHAFNNGLFSNLQVALDNYQMLSDYSTVEIGRDDVSHVNQNLLNSGIRDISAKWMFSYSFPGHNLKAGLESVNHLFSPQTRNNVSRSDVETPVFSSDDNKKYYGWENALFAEDDIRIGSNMSVRPGLRYSIISTQGRTYQTLEPRLSSRLGLGESFAIKASYARMSQYVHLLSSSQISLPTDLWVPVTDNIKPVVSDQVSTGIFYEKKGIWELSVEAYYKWMQNVLDYKDGISFTGSVSSWEDKVASGLGRTAGMEIYARKISGRLTGSLSYTLSKSERRYPHEDINNGKWFPYRYDRRHNVALYLDYSLSSSVELTATWTFASGYMMSVPERVAPVYDIGTGGLQHVNYIPGRNNYRLPPTHSLNVNMTWTVNHRRGKSIIGAGVYNLYNYMNPNIVSVTTVAISDESGGITEMERRMNKITYLPILPSVSYTYSF